MIPNYTGKSTRNLISTMKSTGVCNAEKLGIEMWKVSLEDLTCNTVQLR